VVDAPVDEFGVRAWCVAAARGAEAKNGIGTVILGVGHLMSITDAFIITSGTTARQVRSISEEVEAQVRAVGGPAPLRIEGLDDGRWVLMDYGDFLVHIFIEEAREFYDLERLWRDAEPWAWTPLAPAPALEGTGG
jgi:ribosome-associated protein